MTDLLTDVPVGLLVAVPGLVVVGCLVLFLVGMRLLRADPVEGLDVGDLVLLRETKRSAAGGEGPLQRVARPMVAPAMRALGPATVARLRRLVELAGRPDGIDAEAVVSQIIVWLIIVAPLALLLLLQGLLLLIPLLPLFAVAIPLGRLDRLRRRRQQRIDRDVPDFLDVLSVSVTAGLGFRSAIALVADRFGGPLGEEMLLTLQQIRSGASVRESFQRLKERNDSEALGTFVSAYLQAEELGAPLAHSLTRIAEDQRRASAQRQRQAASRIAPRVTLVTSLVLVPGALALLFSGFIIGTGFDLSSLLGGG